MVPPVDAARRGAASRGSSRSRPGRCRWSAVPRSRAAGRGRRSASCRRGRSGSRRGAGGGRRSAGRRRTRRRCRRPGCGSGSSPDMKRGAARGAERAGGVGIGEAGRALGEAGEVRGVQERRRAVGKQGPGELVDHQDQDVRAGHSGRSHAWNLGVDTRLAPFACAVSSWHETLSRRISRGPRRGRPDETAAGRPLRRRAARRPAAIRGRAARRPSAARAGAHGRQRPSADLDGGQAGLAVEGGHALEPGAERVGVGLQPGLGGLGRALAVVEDQAIISFSMSSVKVRFLKNCAAFGHSARPSRCGRR